MRQLCYDGKHGGEAMKDIILRREMLGFTLGFGYTVFVYKILPLNDMALLALGVIFALFVAFPAIRKYGV